MLQYNKVLQRLNLSNNNMGNATGQQLIKSIYDNEVIEQIELANN